MRQRILRDWERSVVTPSKIGTHVGSAVRFRAPDVYKSAYNSAKQMKAQGVPDQTIREQLRYKLDLREESAEDGPNMSISKRAHNEAEHVFANFHRQGVEHAIAGQPAKVPDTSLYGDPD